MSVILINVKSKRIESTPCVGEKTGQQSRVYAGYLRPLHFIILIFAFLVLHAELRSEHAFPCRYLIVEEDLHFKKEGEKYYRNSKIYRETIDKETGETTNRELILNNHSEVMFDYSLIPADKIR